jgi:hypothetical protein
MTLRELIWRLLEKLGKTQAVISDFKVTNDQTIVVR